MAEGASPRGATSEPEPQGPGPLGGLPSTSCPAHAACPARRPGAERGRDRRRQAEGLQDEAEGVCGLLLQHQPQAGSQPHQPRVLRHQVSARRARLRLLFSRVVANSNREAAAKCRIVLWPPHPTPRKNRRLTAWGRFSQNARAPMRACRQPHPRTHLYTSRTHAHVRTHWPTCPHTSTGALSNSHLLHRGAVPCTCSSRRLSLSPTCQACPLAALLRAEGPASYTVAVWGPPRSRLLCRRRLAGRWPCPRCPYRVPLLSQDHSSVWRGPTFPAPLSNPCCPPAGPSRTAGPELLTMA